MSKLVKMMKTFWGICMPNALCFYRSTEYNWCEMLIPNSIIAFKLQMAIRWYKLYLKRTFKLLLIDFNSLVILCWTIFKANWLLNHSKWNFYKWNYWQITVHVLIWWLHEAAKIAREHWGQSNASVGSMMSVNIWFESLFVQLNLHFSAE